MQNKKHRAVFMQEMVDAGVDGFEIIRRIQADPVYNPKHRDAKGQPLTFEAVVSDYIRENGMTPDKAIRAAAASDPKYQQDYYDRLRIGSTTDMDWIATGNRV